MVTPLQAVTQGSRMLPSYYDAVPKAPKYLDGSFASLTAGGTLQKERGSGTSLSKAEGSRGEVSLLSATQPLRELETIRMERGSI